MEIVILAAGKGSRMRSSLPKVMHRIGGRPMLAHVVATAQSLNPDRIHIVVGAGAEAIRQFFEDGDNGLTGDRRGGSVLNWVTQAEQLGTGHALLQALPHIETSVTDPVLVLPGDVPLVRRETLVEMLTLYHDCIGLGLLTAVTDQPRGLGRIIRGESGQITAIIEERDASAQQKQIKEVNSGIMAVSACLLKHFLKALGNSNDQGEYYLTDLVAMADVECFTIVDTTVEDSREVMGVNDREQLVLQEQYLQMRSVEQLLGAGVTVRDPTRLDIRGEVCCGADTEIDCNVILEGTVSLGSGVSVGANVIISNSVIGDGVQILPGTLIEGSTVGDNASVGPMARLRPGTELGEGARIGNFVETKNARIGNGSKASHLAYLGDVEMGEGCNIGAGTVVCNYDGVNKQKTVIGNNVFVGSNSTLVAPLVLEDHAFVAAGSTVTVGVPADSLAVARGRQRNITGWTRPAKKDR